MKNLLLILFLLTSSFSASLGQVDKSIKTWCLAVDDQNKELKNKLVLKDSIINNDGTEIVLKNKAIASYERDIDAYKIQWSTYSKIFLVKDSIISEQKTELKKTKGERNVSFGIIIVLVLIELFK